MSGSPTKRSLQALRADGWRCAIVEHWNAHMRIRQDMFGCIDILAIKPGEPVLFVQTTTAGHVSHRLAKIRGNDNLPALLAAGRVEIHGWAKPTKTIPKWRQRVVLVQVEGELEETRTPRMTPPRPPRISPQVELELGEERTA